MNEAQHSSPPSLNPAGQFDFWWQHDGEWVEEPNQRRGGESGVKRVRAHGSPLLYAKRQVGHTYRSLRYPLGRPTVLRERDALAACRLLGVPVPNVVFCAAQQESDKSWRALLVTEALDGFQDIDCWYAGGGRERIGEAPHQDLLRHIGEVLARLHRGRWQHGCLYSKHVFVRVTEQADRPPQIDVALLDLEKSRRRLSRRRAALHDMRQLRRHSSWNAADWQQLIYGYQAAYGSAIKGLQS
ncbi:InaA protein [Pseudomonas sp. LS44]|uniref:lipopolysaccharide kinase InaA family protein n=1 Tax=Pseudomonas sp. LS44 TaxID=1357074 RepID=UPI00215B6309|nr:lipopolysaccharide kinase InaA family protein [Pseudomonas sp. LS44]UVE18634.1 InaA protein [Pseudomonas sp. LS44]